MGPEAEERQGAKLAGRRLGDGEPREASGRRPGAMKDHPPILLFDGVCNLCDASVQFVMRHDPDERFRFASLQSQAARPYLERAGLSADYLASLVLVDEAGRVHVGSDAALGVGVRLEAPWRQLATAGAAVPKPIREAVYRFVARHRYRVFGQKVACRLPTPEERARFLDADEPVPEAAPPVVG